MKRRRMICGAKLPKGRIASLRCSAFTLVEMLVVIAVVAILTALTLPALQGLAGTNGLRGGVNTVLATLDQARAAAIENGANVYVGFPPPSFRDSQDPFLGHASMVVFRGPRHDEPEETIKPLSRWIRLPAGIAVVASNMSLTNVSPSPEELLPKLAGQKVSPLVIQYDRFGRIKTSVTSGTNLVIGEAVIAGNTVNWKGNNKEILSAQRLTGRWVATRP